MSVPSLVPGAGARSTKLVTGYVKWIKKLKLVIFAFWLVILGVSCTSGMRTVVAVAPESSRSPSYPIGGVFSGPCLLLQPANAPVFRPCFLHRCRLE
jgi:hypothetical protein